jgi:UDP-glucose 4-epimerase
MKNRKRVLITGGAGFIGSHLVDHAVSKGCEVIVVDNFSNGRPENIAQQEGNARVRVMRADIAELSQIESHFEEVDYVFHLAALADIVPSVENPSAYHRANVDGTFNCLLAAKKHAVKRFIYAASSSCYGLADVVPTPESAEIRPQYPYALTKNMGEQYVLHFAKLYGLPACSLRFFNVYGPRSRTSGTYGAVFGVFLKQKLADVPYTVVGNGNQTRDFTYVSDIVDALWTAAESNVAGEAMNVGNGQTYSINRLVDLLGGPKIHIPKRPGEPDCTFADISKICRLLGWQPKVSFEEGVRKVLDNIDYWAQAPLWTPESIASATESWFKYLTR